MCHPSYPCAPKSVRQEDKLMQIPPPGASQDMSQEKPSPAPCLTWSFTTRLGAKFPSAASCISLCCLQRAREGWRVAAAFLRGH